MIKLAGLFVVVVALALWVFFASSLLDGLGAGRRASVLETVSPTATPAPVATVSPTATASPPTPTPTPAPSPTATSGAGPQQYTVEPGDSLSRIANRFNVTVEALQAANDIDNPSSIVVGQVIVIPAPN